MIEAANGLTEYDIWFLHSDGYLLEVLDEVAWFQYIKRFNGIGNFVLQLPTGALSNKHLMRDAFVLFFRRDRNGKRALDFLGMLRWWKIHTTPKGITYLTLRGPDQNDLLRRRIVAYAAGRSETMISVAYADDALKDIFNENYLSGAESDRDISGRSVSTQPDFSSGADLEMRFAWDDVLEAMKDICDASFAESIPVPMYFEIAVKQLSQNGYPEFEFKTHVNHPGIDRTANSGHANPVIFGVDHDNLRNPSLTHDYNKEKNYVYVGGQGEQRKRTIVEVEDAFAVDASPFNRCEIFRDARNTDDDELTEVGQQTLHKHRGTVKFAGTLLDTEQTPYGDWQLGDKVSVTYEGMQFDVPIHSVSVRLSKSREEVITASVESFEHES